MNTVAELFVARGDDEHIGLRFEDDSWTWRDVVQAAAVRAHVLQSLRVDGPFHVGVLLENVPEFVFLLGAGALSGAAIVGINPTRRGDELARDIRHTHCQLIVTEQRLAGLLDGLDLGVPPDRVLTIEDDAWSSLVEAHTGAALPRELPRADTLFALIFTSGSTGAPKAVRVTQGRMAEAAAAMGFTHDDVLYCAAPLFHGNALSGNVFPALGAGATIALRRRFSASACLPDVRRFGATFFNTVGRALAYVLATPPSEADRDHQLKYVLAPESSDADVAAFQERFGCIIVTGYGSSEGAIKMMPVRRSKPGALGRPPVDIDVAVVDADTSEECPRAQFDANGRLLNGADAIGEIVRRDPTTRFEGYYNNPDADAERMRNGWFWSGDLAYRDDDGVFYFAGRSGDWLRVDAENFAAAPVERIIGRHPDIAGVAVYGVPDPRTGDQVMAAIELREGRAFDADAFPMFLDSQPDLGTKWAPRFVRVVASLPVTGTQKVDKQPLRTEQWYGDDATWWRPDQQGPFRRFTDDDIAALEREFARHGRVALLPRR
jgi:fatty-acyl-CoA synthase